MTPQLESITLTNFRSINVPVMIPLDAPVVLIHGQNGTGKTSILSGIELALTGDIPSLRRLDSDYKHHLVHKGAKQARLDLIARGLPHGVSDASLIVTSDSIVGVPLLGPELAKTYSERCYLAQATLGRLIEIYQSQDPKSSSSPLTLFVKELLGLDVIGSIVDGLHDAGDVRRVRNAVPGYSDVERRISETQRRLAQIAHSVDEIDATITSHLDRLKTATVSLGLSIDLVARDYSDILTIIESESSKNRLMNVARTRRDLLAANERLKTLEIDNGVDQRTRLEESDLSARRQLEQWRQGRGLLLNETIETLVTTFPSLPSPSSADPEVARLAALRAVEAELHRYSELIARQEEVAKRLIEVQTQNGRLEERSRRLDEQIGSHAADAGSLAQALAGLLSHIHSEECPVCGRDFQEISKTPLASDVSKKVGALNESAGMLEALLREKSVTATQLASIRREKDELAAVQVSQVITEQANTERARLQSLKLRLDSLAEETARARILLQNASIATRKVSEARESDDQLSSLIETVRRAALQLEQEFIYPDQTLRVELSRLLDFTAKEEAVLNTREEHRGIAATQVRALQTQQASRISLIQGAVGIAD